MNNIQNAIGLWGDDEYKDSSLEDLEDAIDSDLGNALSDLEILKEDREKIGDPASLSETVMNVVWEQFVNQVGAVAGEEFIKENRGMTLDLRKSVHIQTTENFEKGKIANHNSKINYQKRYDDWQDNFQKNEDGSIKTRPERRSGEDVAVLKNGARDYIDNGRPTGSASIHKDHTISAAEIIRDPAANAHLSRDEHAEFANSEVNLVDLDASANMSKSDSKMEDWLDSERFGKKPSERFDIDEDELRERDKKAREEYERVKKEGEKRSIETGKRSRREEATRMGKKALQGIVMGLLAALVKTIFQKFAVWLKSKNKSLSSFIEKVKEAIHKFISELKEHLKIAAQSAIGTLATMIFGPVVRVLQKAWTFLKQGYKSLREALNYIKNPNNKKKPFSILMMEVGKIIISGLSATGAIVLGGAIEGTLSAVPFFAFEIPLLGSLASIIGLFLGALVSGLIGALALNLIDKWIAKKQRKIQTRNIIVKNNEVLDLQAKKIAVSGAILQKTKIDEANAIVSRHQEAASVAKAKMDEIKDNLDDILNDDFKRDITPSANQNNIDNLSSEIDAL